MPNHVLIGAVFMAAAVVDFAVGTFVVLPRMPEEKRGVGQIAFFGGALVMGGVGAAIIAGIIPV